MMATVAVPPSSTATSSTIQLDARLFQRRLRHFFSHWKEAHRLSASDTVFHQSTVCLISVGAANEETPYQKSTALHSWLFGYELPDTVMVLTLDPMTCFIVTSQKKATLLHQLQSSTASSSIPIEIMARLKDSSNQTACFEKILDLCKDKTVGHLPKDQFDGAFYQSFQSTLSGASLTLVDVAQGVAHILAQKDEEALKYIKTAAKLSSLVMKDYFSHELLSIVDEDKKVTHEKLAAKTEALVSDARQLKQRFKSLAADLSDWDQVENCYAPIIQSNGNVQLKPSAVSDTNVLDFNAIVCSLGVRYHSYCSNVARTYLIDPSEQQERDYQFLLDLERFIIASMQHGTSLQQIYERGVSRVQEERPDLAPYLVKNFGFGMGLMFRESEYVIHGKNSLECLEGMVMNVSVGFQDIPLKTNDQKKYSLWLCDTVRITSAEPLVLTEAPKNSRDICYFFDKEESKTDGAVVKKEKQQQQQEQNDGNKRRPVRSAVLSKEDEESKEQRRRLHQKQLAEQKLTEALQRYGPIHAPSVSQNQEQVPRYESYKRESQLPREMKPFKVYVDKRQESVIIPIFGLPVPFHVQVIKSLSRTEEGETVYLRFHFDLGKNHPILVHLRSVTLQSGDVAHFNGIYRDVQDLKKMVTKREVERKEMADLVQQSQLQLVQGSRPIRLGDVYMRPAFEGKRLPGDVELHMNGLRYRSQLAGKSSSSGATQTVDILFNNIQHFFFQPCDHESIVLVHCHLKHSILVGKKKTRDIQFYREALDHVMDETNASGSAAAKRRKAALYGMSGHDEDELAAEQEERRRRAQINLEFKQFAHRVQEASQQGSNTTPLQVDMPFRELGFHGVPHRQNVLLQPTTECLVHLTDPPFLVVPLSQVELAQLERVSFGLKNFDLVFIMQDHSLPPVHIHSIPMTRLEAVKAWLDSVDVVFAEAPINYNWTNIMKTVNEDPIGFYEMGGWSFLQQDKSEGESGDEEDDSDEEESEFEIEDDEDESESEEDSEEESDFSLTESESEEDDDEEAPDWDELEKETLRKEQARKKKYEDDEDSEDNGKRKKRR